MGRGGIMKCSQWNGHGSMGPRFGPCNVLKKNAGMDDEALGFMDITCSGHARLKGWTPAVESVLETRRLLARRETTKGRWEKVIKAAGCAN